MATQRRDMNPITPQEPLEGSENLVSEPYAAPTARVNLKVAGTQRLSHAAPMPNTQRNTKTSQLDQMNYRAAPLQSPGLSLRSQKSTSSKLKSKDKEQRDKTKTEIEIMRQKVLAISCDTFVSRLEYCLENVEMRMCLRKIEEFAQQERKLQAVVNMEQIRQNRIRLDALIQWVKVVYYAELRCFDSNNVPASEAGPPLTCSQEDHEGSQAVDEHRYARQEQQ